MADAPQTTNLRSMAPGMLVAVEIMRHMANEPSIGWVSGPSALRIVAEAIEKQAHANIKRPESQTK